MIIKKEILSWTIGQIRAREDAATRNNCAVDLIFRLKKELETLEEIKKSDGLENGQGTVEISEEVLKIIKKYSDSISIFI